MKNSDTIIQRLENARHAVRKAVEAFDRDEAITVDMRAIEMEVDLAAAAATDMEGEAPATARKALMNLVADLNGLHRRIAESHRSTAASIGQTAASRRAVAAYGRPAGV